MEMELSTIKEDLMDIQHTKVLIIGSGPAGATAAIYAARADLQPVMVSGPDRGGQIVISSEVENFPGFAEKITGNELMDVMLKQATNVGANIVEDLITKVDFSKRPFICSTASGNTYEAETVIISTGAQAKWLGIPSEEHFKGFGVSGCATCDGFFYRKKIVAVVGGGNTAVEEAIYLATLAQKVYLIVRRDSLRAEKVMQDKLLADPKIEVMWNSSIAEILGVETPMKGVNAMRVSHEGQTEPETIAVDGIFIAIGQRPSTDLFIGSGLELDARGYIVTQPGSPLTNIPGVFAAGDVQDPIYSQAITAAGSGCKAALQAQWFLEHNVL